MEKFNINLNLYRSFYYVAKYNGFTNASKHESISQSSLSTNIKNLEYILNKKLINRNISEITLTTYGKELFQKLEEIVMILDDDIQTKEINIGCLRFIADNYIEESLINFINKNSDVKINLFFNEISDLYQMLRKDEIDIIICRYPLFYKFDKHIIVSKLCELENVMVCSKSYYEQEIKNINRDNYTFNLILPNVSEKRRKIEQCLIDNNINYNIKVEIPNSNLLIKLILNGIGIGYVNKKFVSKYIDSGEMVVIDIVKNIPLDDITIIYDSSNEDKLLGHFITLFKDSIKKNDN